MDSFPGVPRLIVAVDYGTTGTSKIIFPSHLFVFFPLITSKSKGVSYVHCGGNADNITTVSKWPPRTRGEKVPSRISYSEGGIVPPLWGFEVTPDAEAFVWTKLLLDQNLQHGDFNDEILEKVVGFEIMKLPAGRDAVTTIADFLAQLYNIGHQAQRLPRVRWNFGSQCQPAGLRRSRVSCRMQYNYRAGFGSDHFLHRVNIMSEPEAAALSIVHETELNLQCGDGVLVCDCGGGTVDITTLYITEIDPIPCFDQITTVTGGRCGGAAIDARLYQLLAYKYMGACDEFLPRLFRPGSQFMNAFQQIKQDFDGTGDKSWKIPVECFKTEIIPFSQKAPSVLVLDSRDLCDLYDPVLSRIFALIMTQITAANTHCRRNIINVSTVVYVAKRGRRQRFPEEPLFEPVSDVSRPLTSVGDIMGERYPTHYQAYQNVRLFHWQHESPIKPIEIYECTLVTPPCQLDPHLQILDGLLTSNELDTPEGMACIDLIACDFCNVDLSRFPHQIMAGRMMYELEIAIQVSLTDHTIQFCAYALGQEIGRKEVLMANH
ncbi:hypothetical protein ASPZODRAFT_169644 [Penicilliopsis zonata CBS 506.65]|uniref:Actin-like ATPase domain-containing protein n=1 Tax=Penicilliopsis zonata CBS 506.65 TaxID=1073090 RepID=A0A1L9S7D2_9EURO|nr:hypothetical protein ASPZODRAFT_169644 [Penicilliopsis zonata CBS 506.65]OJJ43061.1 hypothetical protein ASPZODRAFT_169644 [Penicilliopsis zonata CBS 506.65]